MANRPTKEPLYLKYEFSDQEKLSMANTLASNHNAIDDIDAEEAVFKSQIKERRSGLAQSIQTLSRSISMGFEMRNIPCAIQYDQPNIGEVQYVRLDTGEIARTRTMTESERQMDLPLAGEYVVVPPEKSSENIANFFDASAIVKAAAEGEELPAQDDADNLDGDSEPEDPFTNPDPAAALEAIKPEHDADFEGTAEAPRKRGRPAKAPQGFSKPTNSSAISDF